MQANAKKARRLKEIGNRDDDPSDTFNSMVSEDPISDDALDGFIRNDRIKLNQDSLCVAENPTDCPNSDEYEHLCQSLKCSYNYHMGDCNGIMNLDWQVWHTCQFSITLIKLSHMAGICFMVG